MEFISRELLQYCESFSEVESELLKELNRQTHLKVNSPRMLSGHLQGRFLAFISQLLQPKTILEIGTYTGYSALCLLEGLQEDGKLITIDPNEETNAFARQFFVKHSKGHLIQLLEGDAQRIIPDLHVNPDLVFIDADKKNYATYYDLVVDQLKPGGVILADNVLWSGKILDENKDADTLAIHNFNKKIQEDKRVSNCLLPVRDGLMLIRKVTP